MLRGHRTVYTTVRARRNRPASAAVPRYTRQRTSSGVREHVRREISCGVRSGPRGMQWPSVRSRRRVAAAVAMHGKFQLS